MNLDIWAFSLGIIVNGLIFLGSIVWIWRVSARVQTNTTRIGAKNISGSGVVTIANEKINPGPISLGDQYWYAIVQMLHNSSNKKLGKSATEDKNFQKLRRHWKDMDFLSVIRAIQLGIFFTVTLSVFDLVAQYLDLGTYIRLDAVDVPILTNVVWGLKYAILVGTCLYATGHYKNPAKLLVVLAVSFAALISASSVAVGMIATDNRQYVGFVAGVIFTLFAAVFGAEQLHYKSVMKNEYIGSRAVSFIQAAYSLVILHSIARHLVILLAPEGVGVIVDLRTSLDILVGIDLFFCILITYCLYQTIQTTQGFLRERVITAHGIESSPRGKFFAPMKEQYDHFDSYEDGIVLDDY